MTDTRSTGSSLGALIRERRLGFGLSLGQLASAVSTSVNEVRRWERGEEAPEREVQEALAEFLEIDADVVAELAAAVDTASSDETDQPETPTELFAAASGVSPTSVSPPEPPPAAGTAPADDQPPEGSKPGVAAAEPAADFGEHHVEPAAAALEPAYVPGERAQPPPPAPSLREAGPSAAVPRPVPLRYPESAPPGVPVEITEAEPNRWNLLRYLYHPEQPWLYWVRAGLTVVVLLILVNILFDSVSELFDKLGEFLDTIEPTEGIEEAPGTVEGP